MYKILKKKSLNPTVTLMDIEAPLVAKKAEPGQFIILRVDEEGERIPLTVADFDRDAEPPPEALGRLQGQLPLILDDPADVVGQAAVGVGDVARALEDDDLGLLVQTAEPGCGRCAARDSAHDHDFHINAPPFRDSRRSRRCF